MNKEAILGWNLPDGREALPMLCPSSLRGKLHTKEGRKFLKSIGDNPDDWDWEAYKKMHKDKNYKKEFDKQASARKRMIKEAILRGFLKKADDVLGERADDVLRKQAYGTMDEFGGVERFDPVWFGKNVDKMKFEELYKILTAAGDTAKRNKDQLMFSPYRYNWQPDTDKAYEFDAPTLIKKLKAVQAANPKITLRQLYEQSYDENEAAPLYPNYYSINYGKPKYTDKDWDEYIDPINVAYDFVKDPRASIVAPERKSHKLRNTLLGVLLGGGVGGLAGSQLHPLATTDSSVLNTLRGAIPGALLGGVTGNLLSKK